MVAMKLELSNKLFNKNQAFKHSFLHFVFWSRACRLMSIYLEKFLTDVCKNWHIVEAIQVEEVGLK